jgi:hypothetical protein
MDGGISSASGAVRGFSARPHVAALRRQNDRLSRFTVSSLFEGRMRKPIHTLVVLDGCFVAHAGWALAYKVALRAARSFDCGTSSLPRGKPHFRLNSGR